MPLTENTSAHVLIVDDNPAKLIALEAALAGMGIQVVTATSGTDALRKLLEQDFAAVMLDVNMPVMDGFETAEMIRRRPRTEHLPIIFITAERLTDESRLQGYGLGAVDYILSPVLPEILRAKVGVFADLFRLRAESIRFAQEIAEKNAVIDLQNRQLTETNLSLQQLNETLEQRVTEEVAHSREKDHLLIHQSRLAVVGEMLGNIAHQWRQPLNALALVLGNILDAEQYNELTAGLLAKKIADAQRLIDKMSATINDFRDFFRPDKKREPFCICTSLKTALMLVEASFMPHGIKVVTDIVEDVWTEGVANEYSQVVLNLLGNAKEAIIARQSDAGRNKPVPPGVSGEASGRMPDVRGQIVVRLDRDGNMARLTVTDNGGGIEEQALPHLFEPYFSTKPGGTGIGLYMSQMIIKNTTGGRLSARNVGDGAEFTLLTPLAAMPER
ncbi:MAG: hybrid sensor histidine kinase/response regulator [Candidatus Methylumidiphilus sp.]